MDNGKFYPGHEHKTNKGGINNERDQIISNIRERGYIATDDEITFHTIFEVLNELFDKGYRGYQKAVCPVDRNQDAWFPKLDVIRRGRQYPGSKSWHNYFLNSSQDILVEYPTRECDLVTLVWPPENLLQRTAYVFAKHEGSYRFFGNFVNDGIATARELKLTVEINPNEPVVIFRRINKEAKLPKKK